MACVRTNLLTIDTKVRSPFDVVYSTDPWKAEGEDEVTYFIKGTDLEIVFAEIVGCKLAREVGLPVPDVAACGSGSETYAGSTKVGDAIRDVEPWMTRPQKVKNFDDLFSATVVDVWLANKDRNIGNVVAKPRGGANIELVFIDFEKSKTLRPNPIVLSTMLEPRELWPSGLLGQHMRARKPLHPPQHMIEQIRALPAARCTEIINEVVAAVGSPVAWVDHSIHALSNRASRIQQLTEEVWATI